MRLLIDGYNVMHAAGVMARRFGPDGFRRARNRFLNDLAAALDPVDAHQTTVVFDAADPPPDQPRESRHKGLTVLFAVGDESADERIEHLIASHPAPKALTVVSSDNRVRAAAGRRRARARTADEFLVHLDDLRRRSTPRRAGHAASSASEPRDSPEELARSQGPSAVEAAYWAEQFRDLDDSPGLAEELAGHPQLLTDEDIARLEREIEREFRARPKG